MNCWGIRIYFTKSRFSLNEGLLFIWSYCYNNNNHGSTALYGLGPPLASSFRGYWVVRIRGSWCSIDPDVTARAIWQAVRRLG